MGAGGLVPPAADAPQFGPPPDPVEEGVAEILREKQAADEQVGRVSEMSDGEADAEAQPEPDDDDGEGGDSPRSLPATEQAASAEGKDGDDDDDAASAAVSAAREPLTPDDLVLAAELPRGRLYITCVSGEEMRKKNETGKAGQRINPYIKIRLGEGERHPFYNTQPVRKQGKDPEFNDEVLTFDIKDPFDFVLHGDLKVRFTPRVFFVACALPPTVTLLPTCHRRHRTDRRAAVFGCALCRCVWRCGTRVISKRNAWGCRSSASSVSSRSRTCTRKRSSP